jgi:hypothetical protein
MSNKKSGQMSVFDFGRLHAYSAARLARRERKQQPELLVKHLCNEPAVVVPLYFIWF